MFSKEFSRKSFAVSFAAIFMLMSVPAYSGSPVYSWQDPDGVITFTDDLSRAPSNAKIKVFQSRTSPQTASAEPAAVLTPSRPYPQSTRVATEGEFAVQLVEELGLNDNPTAEEAAGILTDIRVVPKLGQWELNQPMTENLTVRLRNLAVAAAESGRIELSPDEVLLAFDTTAALLGLTIPVNTEPEEASEEASKETSNAPYPLAETPPLVYVEPPPAEIYPYYVWYPVAGGFWWWNGVFCSGFFALNTALFFDHHHHGNFSRGHVWDSGRIGRQFSSRIVDHHFTRNPGFSERNTRSVSAERSSVSNSFSNRMTRQTNGMRSSGMRFSGVTSEGQRFSQRSTRRSMPGRPVYRQMSTNRPVYRQPSSYRPAGRVYGISRPQSTSSVRYATRSAPSGGFSGRSFSTSAGHGFSRGSIGGSMGGAVTGISRGGSGFSAGFRSSRGR